MGEASLKCGVEAEGKIWLGRPFRGRWCGALAKGLKHHECQENNLGDSGRLKGWIGVELDDFVFFNKTFHLHCVRNQKCLLRQFLVTTIFLLHSARLLPLHRTSRPVTAMFTIVFKEQQLPVGNICHLPDTVGCLLHVLFLLILFKTQVGKCFPYFLEEGIESLCVYVCPKITQPGHGKKNYLLHCTPCILPTKLSELLMLMNNSDNGVLNTSYA